MLSNVSILVTTFLRDGYLRECLRRIQHHLPECPIIVVDDGHRTAEKDAIMNSWHDNTSCNHQWITLPFDSGLPAKRNIGVKHCISRYLLMGCDDFDFSPIEARLGIQKLRGVMDMNPDIDVAGGRHNGNPYEGFLEYVKGSHIREHRLVPIGGKDFYPVDLTVNYFLARTESIRNIPWDERMKIGGEHGDWFLELKHQGKKVVWVPDVNIREFHMANGANPEYGKYRARARDLGHKIFLEKRGIRDYYGFP